MLYFVAALLTAIVLWLFSTSRPTREEVLAMLALGFVLMVLLVGGK